MSKLHEDAANFALDIQESMNSGVDFDVAFKTHIVNYPVSKELCHDNVVVFADGSQALFFSDHIQIKQRENPCT